MFGQVKQGQEIVNLIENLPVDDSSRPISDVIISHCGELMLKKSLFFLNLLNYLQSFNVILIIKRKNIVQNRYLKRHQMRYQMNQKRIKNRKKLKNQLKRRKS